MSSINPGRKLSVCIAALAMASAVNGIVATRWISAAVTASSLVVAVSAVLLLRSMYVLPDRNVLELAQASREIIEAAEHVSISSQSLAEGSLRQVLTIQATSSASIEIQSMAQRNTENAQATAAIVSGSEAAFEEANRSLAEMVQAMEEIAESSSHISSILKVIDEIAFQTNILAINAAVEAARAGDAGVGFAVVAEEVRNLSERCAEAAKNTSDLIEESIARSYGGKQRVDQVNKSIHDLTSQSSRIRILVDEIHLSSVEQLRGIDEISRSLIEMKEVTQSSTETGAENTASAGQLNIQSRIVTEVVRGLRALISGAREATVPLAAVKITDTVDGLSASATKYTRSRSFAVERQPVSLRPKVSAGVVTSQGLAEQTFPMGKLREF